MLCPPLSGGDHSKSNVDEKADLAFKAFDKNRDGYITKGEMLKTSKNLTKKQVDDNSNYKSKHTKVPSTV